MRVALAVLLAGVVLCGGCECRVLPRTGPATDTVPVTLTDTLAAAVQTDLAGFSVNETKGNELSFRLQAQHAQQLQSGDVPLQQMTVVFCDGGRETLELVADSGVFHEQTRDITLQGNVVATGLAQPVKFYTESLYWHNAQELLRTESRVRVERDAMTLTGTGMVADKTLQRLELQRDIVTEMR